MVDVGGKAVTERSATARGTVRISPELAVILQHGELEKGDAFTVAKTAAILAAKQTGNLVPMCHPLPIDVIDVDLTLDPDAGVVIIEASKQVYVANPERLISAARRHAYRSIMKGAAPAHHRKR